MKTVVFDPKLSVLSQMAKPDLAQLIGSHLSHGYLQCDGTFVLPNSREGDILKAVICYFDATA